MPSQSLPGQQGSAVPWAGTGWETGTVLVPQSSGCSPWLPHPSPAALGQLGLVGHCQVTAVVPHMMHKGNFQLLAVPKVYAALGHSSPKGCQQALLLINRLSKWSLLFCLQNVWGVIRDKWKEMLKDILLCREASDLFMNADFGVVLLVRVIVVASGRACSLLSIPGHWEPPGCKSTMANGRQGWVEIREQQPKPLCRNGSRDAGTGQHWHRHTLWHLFFWSSFSSQGMMAIGHSGRWQWGQAQEYIGVILF